MAGPRTKRQFAGAASDPAQRSITSFFNKSTNTTASANAATKSNQPPLNGPHIPGQIQTDLLNVGMRVRKAIPEGYKTGSAYSGFTLWSEDNVSNPTTTDDAYPTSTNPAAAPTSHLRELEPFCGINRVGGLAFQPSYDSSSSSIDDMDDMDDMDAMPGLTSSQDTIASTTSSFGTSFPTTTTTTTNPNAPLNIATAFHPIQTPTPTRKRIFTSDEDDATAETLNNTITLPYRGPVRLSSDSPEAWLLELEEEISPRNVTPPAGLWESARVLAVPRRSRSRGVGSGSEGSNKGSVGGGGQEENVMVVVRKGGDGNDFEEASFLDYGLTDGRMEIE